MTGASWVKLCAMLLATAAASVAGARKPEFARPPYTGAYEPQGVDERGQWMEVDEIERSMRDSPIVVRDPSVNLWLKQVLCRTIGDDRCSTVRIYLIRDPWFNASMASNGMMIVHTGMLVRLHSEAELAAVMGHEFAHFERRHGLAGFRKGRSANDAIAWLALAGAVASRSTTDMRNNIVGGYYHFGRSQEIEADILSTDYVRASPFRPHSAAIWFRMVNEDDQRRIARGLKPGASNFTGWLDSHPSSLTRGTYLSAIETQYKMDGEDGIAEYAGATAHLMPELLDTLVKGNDFGGADYVITSRAEDTGWTGLLHNARGELYRLRGNQRDLATAQGFYQQATAYPDAPPEAWRGLGLCTMRLGDVKAGRAALAEYLKRSPEARDAASIKMLLES